MFQILIDCQLIASSATTKYFFNFHVTNDLTKHLNSFNGNISDQKNSMNKIRYFLFIEKKNVVLLLDNSKKDPLLCTGVVLKYI